MSTRTLETVQLASSRTPPGPQSAARPDRPLGDFPALLDKHRAGDPSTASVELYAREFVQLGLPVERLWAFIRMVCGWGNSPFVGGNIVRYNARQTQDLHRKFVECREHLDASNSRAAIACMSSIEGMNVSFASKHLKFLAPEKAVVLDSLISRGLGYALTTDGYVEFVEKCQSIAERLNQAGLRAKALGGSPWRVSDVEMAIFMHVKETAPPPVKKQKQPS